MTRLKILLPVLLILMLAACASAGTGEALPAEQETNSDLPSAPVTGALAPAFETTDLAGNPVALEDQRGKIVLLNFWATWCTPCRSEMPAFQARFEQLAPDLSVVAVNFDEPAGPVQEFADELGLTFDIYLDPGGEIQQLYQVRGYPTSMFLDAEGVIRIVHVGAMSEEQLDGYLTEMGLMEES